jgi:hypothetical protein
MKPPTFAPFNFPGVDVMTLNRLFPLLALLCLTLTGVSNANATGTRGIVIEPSSRNTSNQLALVIGNDYDGESGKLQNPVNDADDMRETLTRLGFEVMGDNQQNLEDMNALVREFGDRLRPGMVGLFYFAPGFDSSLPKLGHF